MSESKLKPEELAEQVDYDISGENWLNPSVEFRRGVFNYSGTPQSVEYLQQPNPRKWQPTDPDWKLPGNTP